MILFSKYVLIPLFKKHFLTLWPSAKEKNPKFPLQSTLKNTRMSSEHIICSVFILSSSQPLGIVTVTYQSLHAWIWGSSENPPRRSSQTLPGLSGDLWLGLSQCSGWAELFLCRCRIFPAVGFYSIYCWWCASHLSPNIHSRCVTAELVQC